MLGENSKAIKVFLSYSHDTDDHKKRVLALSEKLRSEGIDAQIDQYVIAPYEGWPRWTTSQIEEADFVLLAFTEQYKLRFEGRDHSGIGHGATWEGAVVTQEIYESHGKNKKFVPIVFDINDSENIPIALRSFNYYVLDSAENYDELYRRITNQPKIQKGALGQIKVLPALQQDSDFWGSSSFAQIKRVILRPHLCTKEVELCSTKSESKTSLLFINTVHEVVNFYWINYQGERVFYGKIPPSSMREQVTYLTHPWVVTDLSGRCLEIFIPEKDPGIAVIRKLSSISPNSPENLTSLKSENYDNPTFVRFANDSSIPVKLYWINYEGNRVFKGEIQKDGTNNHSTFLTHPFLITDLDENPICLFWPIREPALAIIDDSLIKQSKE